jgi:hypothetical protein
MRNNLVNMTIADYSAALARGEIKVDRSYQRSPQVWPAQAQSFLIETILLDYPVPKLALHQLTDIKSKKTIKYVVDGQQRTNAITAFYRDEFRLSKSLETADAAGCTLSELPDEYQEAFLAYPLQFDQFEAATDADVRDYFRRINSFTAPLNAEEQRHARYQGPMKWLVNSLSTRYGSMLVDLDVLTEKSVIRMADAKFISEIVHALEYGISTTSKVTLDRMYAAYERKEEVPNDAAIRTAIDDALNFLVGIEEIQNTSLAKMNVFYSLLLAVILVQQNWATLREQSPTLGKTKIHDNSTANLLTLAASLEDPDAYAEFAEFTEAAAEKTNTKDQRSTRVAWLAIALSQPSLSA